MRLYYQQEAQRISKMKLKVKAFLVLITFIPAVVNADHWPQSIMESIDVKEAAFCRVLDSYTQQIGEAEASKNDIRVRRVYDKQVMDIKALIPTGEFQDWIIKVQSITLDSLLNATLKATLPCHKTIFGLAIPPTNTMAYEQLADVGRGDYVLVSGTLNFERDKRLTPQEFGANFSSIVGLN